TITGITFQDGSFVFDNTQKSLAISGNLPDGTSVAYANNSRTNAGTQQATATITGANYVTLVLTADLTVTPATLTITATPEQLKVYGEADPVFSYTVSGFAGGDDENILSGQLDREAGENVGSYTIGQGSLVANPNYTIEFVSADFVIVKKALTITADDKSKVYGSEIPTLTFSYTGLVNGDTQVDTEPGITTTAIAGSDVGTYPIVLSGGSDDNYEITLVDGELEVTRADLTISADDLSRVYGEENPVLTFTYTGLVNGDTQVTTEPNISTTANINSNVGTYPITLSGGSDANYEITLIGGTLEISQATLKIIANEDQSKIFGTADPVFSFTASGFAAGDSEEVLSGSLTRDPGEAVGIYPINLGSVSAGENYQIDFTGADFEIFPAIIEVVMQPDGVETSWAVNPELPATVTVMTVDGQFLELPVTWNLSGLVVFSRGDYTLTGTIDLPAGILNPDALTAEIVVTVLPKPAPEDILLDNNSYEAAVGENFIAVGNLSVIDPFDNQHDILLADLALDNVYFEIIDGILFWSSAQRADGKTEFDIRVRVVDRDGNIIEKEFTIFRTRPSVDNIEVFNSFTPNGDGINDTWGVEELRFYTGSSVQVFERSGKRVFYTEDPDVRWDGTFQGRELPVGTYYWVIQVKETGETRRGMLNLIRK
ncbi:MBG domain-containing protein, partial [Mongoliibacter ruber]